MQNETLKNLKNRLAQLERLPLQWLEALLNGEVPDAIKSNPVVQRQAKTGAQIKKAIADAVRELTGLVEPIVEGNMSGKPNLAALDNLIEIINRQPLAWRFEREVERLETRYLFTTDSIRDLVFAQLGWVMAHNQLWRLRRCLICRRYMFHAMGRKPDFCSPKCSRWHFNQKLHGERRLQTRVKKLWRLARKSDLQLSDKDKSWITATLRIDDLESAEFPNIRSALASIGGDKIKGRNPAKGDIGRYVAKLPPKLRDTLMLPHAYTKRVEKGGGRSRKKQGGRNKKG